MLRVIHKLEEIIGKKADIHQQAEAPADVRATWADITRAREIINWEPEIELDEGLKETVAWYMVERDWASLVATSD
jgi:nucleoside-diphosphate-sugar epimerase